MKFAFIVYDGITLLDFSGVYDPITRIKTMDFDRTFEYDVCSNKSPIKTFEGLEIKPTKINAPLDEYDYVFLPGGNGIAELLKNQLFLSWIRNVSPNTIMTSVCGGSIILGAAGFLKNKEATTNPALMQYLKKFTEKVSDSRIVDDGNIITAGGVTSSIDLGLYLCEKIAGSEARMKIQKQMDYPLNKS